MINVLIVDDSAFMRKLLSDVFAAETDFYVVDTARNGKDAIEKIKRLKPDVVTLDVEMPILDGINALNIIMRECPVPVVMISSLTHDGAEATLQALDAGAVDFIAKISGPISRVDGIRQDIIDKCRAAASVDVRKLRHPVGFKKTTPAAIPSPVVAAPLPEQRIIAIGTSTGGPRALQEVLTRLPRNLNCGIVIVQHMPPGFTKSLADRLNNLSALEVKEAEQNDIIRPGLALIAPGDFHMTLVRVGSQTTIQLSKTPPIGGHRPAVDPMMESVAKLYGAGAIGVLLTGMGQDGARGMQQIKRQNGGTIAEHASTTVVNGMPKSAIELGVVDVVLPLHDIAAEIVKRTQHKIGGV